MNTQSCIYLFTGDISGCWNTINCTKVVWRWIIQLVFVTTTKCFLHKYNLPVSLQLAHNIRISTWTPASVHNDLTESAKDFGSSCFISWVALKIAFTCTLFVYTRTKHEQLFVCINFANFQTDTVKPILKKVLKSYLVAKVYAQASHSLQHSIHGTYQIVANSWPEATFLVLIKLCSVLVLIAF